MDQLNSSHLLITDSKEILISDNQPQSTKQSTLPNRSSSTLQRSRNDFTTMESRRASMKMGRVKI